MWAIEGDETFRDTDSLTVAAQYALYSVLVRFFAATFGKIARPSVFRLLGLHRADEVSFGVVEVDACADCGDVELGHYYFAAGGFYRADGLVDVLDFDGAFEAGHASSVYRFAALVHQTLDAWVFFVAGLDQVEIRWAPGFEPPGEDLLVKAAGTRHAGHCDSKNLEGVGHGASIRDCLLGGLKI